MLQTPVAELSQIYIYIYIYIYIVHSLEGEISNKWPGAHKPLLKRWINFNKNEVKDFHDQFLKKFRTVICDL